MFEFTQDESSLQTVARVESDSTEGRVLFALIKVTTTAQGLATCTVSSVGEAVTGGNFFIATPSQFFALCKKLFRLQ